MRDAFRDNVENRPLYRAIRKYGTSSFQIEEVEKCDNNIVNEREIYWIEYYQSFKKGYNATIGGDGKPYLDYELIIKTYQNCLNMAETARLCNCHEDSVRKILTNNNIEYLSNTQVNRVNYGQVVSQYSLNDDYIKTFPSYKAAAQWLKDNNLARGEIQGIASHIRDVALGRRKTAYKYKWKI